MMPTRYQVPADLAAQSMIGAQPEQQMDSADGRVEAEQFADEDKKVKERVDAKNAFDGYMHSMKSAVEGSGENKGLSEKLDSEEKEKIQDALKDGQSWLDSNPEADAEEIKEKHKEVEGICAPIISKY